jgi:tetrahydrodipicolinate N-succinyltransferase
MIMIIKRAGLLALNVRSAWVAACLFLLTGVAALAGPPDISSVTFDIPVGVVNYQAHLKGPTGSNYVDGLYDVDFRLYTASSGGSAIWGASYKVYVKGGYFGVMLGQTGGTALSNTTYTVTDLWKALWYDDSNPQNNLFLGLTVRQDESHGAIAVPQESAPRQQFLVAPFAFRAEQAYYARKALYDFDIGRNLVVATNATVNGQATLNGVTTLGSNVTVAGTATLSKGATFNGAASFNSTATFAQPVTVQNTSLFNASATFAQAATFSNSVTVSGAVTMNTNLIMNAAVKAASGKTLTLQNDDATAKVVLNDDQTFNVSGVNGNAKISCDSNKNVLVASGGTLDLTATQVRVNAVKPFMLKSYSQAAYFVQIDTGVSTAQYSAMVVGWDAGISDINESGNVYMFDCTAYKSPNGLLWYVRGEGPFQNTIPTWIIHVLFIRNELVDDQRTNWGVYP